MAKKPMEAALKNVLDLDDDEDEGDEDQSEKTTVDWRGCVFGN